MLSVAASPVLYRKQLPSGVTLLEIIVSTTIVVSVMALLIPTFQMSGNMAHDGMLQAALDQKAAMISDEIARSIRYAKGDTVVISQGGTTIQFKQILGYNTGADDPTPGQPEGLILGANLDAASDDPTKKISKTAVIGATVSYQCVQFNSKNCLASYTNGNLHRILTDQLAPVVSYFKQTNKGILVQILVQQINMRVYTANPNASPNMYMMYGIASLTVVPEVP